MSETTEKLDLEIRDTSSEAVISEITDKIAENEYLSQGGDNSTSLKQEERDNWENDEGVDYLSRIIAEGLSQLGRSADGTMQVFLTLTLTNLRLRDISLLKSYSYLQTIVLSNNEISDLKVLGNLNNLVKLDVSHNKLMTLLDFEPPINLMHVNYSHNLIQRIPDLSQHRHLVTLSLDYNNIAEIKGLSSCCCLKNLSLSHNKINCIKELCRLPISYLNLGYNNIRKIENLECLKYLKILNISHNFIRSLKGLQGQDFLQEIILEGNQIIDIAEIRYIRELKLLRKLNFKYNPIEEMNDYRLSILFRLQSLIELDEAHVTADEKVHAMNMFNPPCDIMAARDHMVHTVRSLMQPAKIFDSTLSSVHTPYPMLVLTGPSGCGKSYLVKKLCQEFPDYFGVGVSTTTRPQRKKEQDGLDYFFTTRNEFERDVIEGKFLETSEYAGHLYGLTREAVESIARKGRACAFHMEYEGVLSLKNTGFEPRYILVLPETSEELERKLRDDNYSESLISQSLSRIDMYADVNREKPGFFDVTFISDDLHELYSKLKMLVLDYLGFSPTATTDSDNLAITDLSSSSRVSEDCPRNSDGSSATSKVSRAWSRPRSDISASFQSSKNSLVELASIQRRRNLAKAALAGLNYLSMEQLNNLRRSDGLHTTIDDNFSTLFKLQRSMSAPVDVRNLSFLLNDSITSKTGHCQSPTDIRSEFHSDSASGASSATLPGAPAFSPPNFDGRDSERSPECSDFRDSFGGGSIPVHDVSSNMI